QRGAQGAAGAVRGVRQAAGGRGEQLAAAAGGGRLAAAKRLEVLPRGGQLGARAAAGVGQPKRADARAGGAARRAEQGGHGGGQEEKALDVPNPGTAPSQRPTNDNTPARRPSHYPQLGN